MLNQASGRQIKPGSLTDQHFAAGAAISESKLNIDWAARAASILGSRTVVDFVQVNGKAVSANSPSVTVTAEITPPPATADNERGAVVQDGKNRIILRDAATGEPLIGVGGKEVYGKLTRSGIDYIVTFYTKDNLGAEVPHTVEKATTIDFQYPQRFDLNTVTETFASNEKFVDGAANVSERLDIQQLAKDVFGGAYTLDKDGQANNAKTVIEQLADEVAARGTADSDLQDAIDAEVTARVSAVNGLDTRLATVEGEIQTARGASANLKAELDRISTVASGSNQEVIDARNGKATLSDELTAIRKSVSDEITARTSADTTLGNRATALEGKAHGHFGEDKQVLVGDPLIGTGTYTLQSTEKFVAGDKSLQVFINGMLQMVGVHYNEVEAGGAGTGGTGINLAPNLIEQNDVIQLRWTK